MATKTIIITAAFLLTAVAALAGEQGGKGSAPLAASAEQMKLKNYSAAARLAVETAESGQRDLLLGVIALKQGRDDEAAELLGRAVRNYPLLGDYALSYQARALLQAKRQPEALAAIKLLLKEYPNSPLARRTLLLKADTLFANGNFAEAELAYENFIEKYAAGGDALQASYQSAVCRIRSGNLPGAAKILRSIWLNSPASPEAFKAEKDLQRLAEAGATVAPYTSQELFKRGTALYDQRNYEQALKTFRLIDIKGEKQEFIDRLALKSGQAILKARRYTEAEKVLQDVADSEARSEIRSEASYLMARAIEKSGRDEEAFVAYNRVAAVYPDSAEADDALLDAAFIRKFQNRPVDTVALLAKIPEKYPRSPLVPRITWEIGWGNYLAGQFRDAAETFGRLAANEEYRERALYWHGRSLRAMDEETAAQTSFSTLLQEYPFGYYALQLTANSSTKSPEQLPALPLNAAVLLPVPEGYERVKGLLALGLTEDAGLEMSAARKKVAKGRADLGLARLLLETGSFNSAMALAGSSPLKNSPDSRAAWALLYPAAFSGLVTEFSARAGIPAALAYAVMRAESAFLPTAKSPVGARGLMQLMPDTAAAVLHVKKIDPERLFEPSLNIQLGTQHLRDLLEQYKGDRVAVIASYNAGAHNVNRWKRIYSNLAPDEFVECIPFGETRDYVKKVLAAEAVYRRLYDLN